MKVSLIGLIACCAVTSSAFAAQSRLMDIPGNHPPQAQVLDIPGNHPPQAQVLDIPGNHPPQVSALGRFEI